MLHTARITIAYLFASILLIMFMPVPGSSSDAKDNYVALGFGLESCQTFLQAGSNGLDLPYRHWLTSSLTAVHTLTKATVDIRGRTNMDGMLWLLEQYCIKHRQHSFSHAVEVLVKDLYPRRMTHLPPKKHE